jgi:hypothetical protein
VFVVTLQVPELRGRGSVRVATARLRDVSGVEVVQANLVTGVIVVQGSMSEEAVRVALASVGLPAEGESP